MNRKCQVFTPKNYVEELLDSVGYIKNLYGKKILEDSCGDGNILVAVVQRYIDDCVMKGLSKSDIKKGLSRDIYGVEIDPEQYNKCLDNLSIVLQRNKIESVNWKIFNADYLRWNEACDFQFVVGNPPYITYSELDKDEQQYVKENFTTCEKGKFDYCYAFIEKSVRCLAKDGKMAYLVPSSIFKTVFGEKMRNFIKPYLREIRDYTLANMFDDALVKSAMMILDMENQSPIFRYQNIDHNEQRLILRNELNKKWFFTTNDLVGTVRFGDYFQVAHVVATLLNEAYVLKKDMYQYVDGVYISNGKKIEREVVRETATPRSIRYNKEEKIIFPYSYKDGALVRYSEKEFLDKFPGANAYLNDFRKQLDKRKSDKKALWFEYGRSQALAGLNKEKLLISTVITDKVTAYLLNESCIPYAGMYIVPKTDNQVYGLEDAKAILESEEFMKYVERVGVHISGSSLRITSRDIENYMF